MAEYSPNDGVYLTRVARVGDSIIVRREIRTGHGEVHSLGEPWYIKTTDPDQILARLLADPRFLKSITEQPQGTHFRRDGLVSVSQGDLDGITQQV